MRAGEVHAGEVRAGEGRAGQDRAGEVRVLEVRAGEVSAGEIRAAEVHATEVCATNTCLRQVHNGVVVMSAVTTIEDGQRGVHVREGRSRSRRGTCPFERCHPRIFRHAGRAAGADEGGQYFDDGGLIAGGVVGEAFERVDAAESDLEPVRALLAELLDRPAVAFCDLALFGDRDLVLCGVE